MQLTELVLLLILPLESLLFIISVANKEAQKNTPPPTPFPPGCNLEKLRAKFNCEIEKSMAQNKGLVFWKNTISDFKNKYKMWLKSWGKKSNSVFYYFFCLLKCAFPAHCKMQMALNAIVRILNVKNDCYQLVTFNVVVPKNIQREYGNWKACRYFDSAGNKDGLNVSSRFPWCFLLLSQRFCAFTPQSPLIFTVLNAANSPVWMLLVVLFFFSRFGFSFLLFFFALGIFLGRLFHTGDMNVCVARRSVVDVNACKVSVVKEKHKGKQSSRSGCNRGRLVNESRRTQ